MALKISSVTDERENSSTFSHFLWCSLPVLQSYWYGSILLPDNRKNRYCKLIYLISQAIYFCNICEEEIFVKINHHKNLVHPCTSVIANETSQRNTKINHHEMTCYRQNTKINSYEYWRYTVYCKHPKNSDTWKICCNHSNLSYVAYHGVMCPKNVDLLANSVDPDQTVRPRTAVLKVHAQSCLSRYLPLKS